MAEKEGEYKSKREKPGKYGKEERVAAIKDLITSGFEEGDFTTEECGALAKDIMEPILDNYEKGQIEKIITISIRTDNISDMELRQSVDTVLTKTKLDVPKIRTTFGTSVKSMNDLPDALHNIDKTVTLYSQIGKTKMTEEGDYND